MKKSILPILLFIMFIPFYVNAETCNLDEISISSIAIEEKSENVEEIEEVEASGKNINLNLSMSNVGDSIKYKVVVQNNSNKDYELDKNSFNISSDYIEYNIESEDNSYVVKANSSKTIYLKINYANEVEEEKFESGTYNDNKTMTVNLSLENNSILEELINPKTKTQSYIYIIALILSAILVSYFCLKKKKLILLIIGTIIIIPSSVSAFCKYEIKITSNIVINKKTFLYTHYQQTIGEQVKNITFDNLEDALDDFNHDYIIRITTNKDNIVEELDLVFILNNNIYTLPGVYKTNNYLKIVEEAKSIFGEENCEIIDNGYRCYKDNIIILAREAELVSVSDNSYYCLIYENGRAFCSND